jgi:hypothetical protein
MYFNVRFGQKSKRAKSSLHTQRLKRPNYTCYKSPRPLRESEGIDKQYLAIKLARIAKRQRRGVAYAVSNSRIYSNN